MIAAGAHVPNGTTVPANHLYAGSPAKFLRELEASERESLKEKHEEYLKLSEVHTERSLLVTARY